MNLLFDENLPPFLVGSLADIYPGSTHVRDCALQRGSDLGIWEFARREGFTIVTKDSDFDAASKTRGHPPKVIWIRLGNCSTRDIENLLLTHSPVIHAFEQDETQGLLELP